jgi:hypothetical protein
LRIDVAQHITKHNLLHEEQNVRDPAFWAETSLHEFYFEVSYLTELAHPDRSGNIPPSERVLLTGFPADPYNEKIHDPSRLQRLFQWFAQLQSNELYDITRPGILDQNGVIPLRYAGRDLPLTKAVQAWVSKKQRQETRTQPITVHEVTQLINAHANMLSEE